VTLTPEERDALKQQVVACLRNEPEVRRIVLFGSFVGSPSPQDEEGGQYDER
jgi:predicted nucleotidyltransferase